MIIYPVLFRYLGLADVESGYMIGATIHDVAQVVGAGYSESETAGDIATFTTLLRVALLPVACWQSRWFFAKRPEAAQACRGLSWPL